MKKMLAAISLLALTACSTPTDPQLNIAPSPVLEEATVLDTPAFTLESRDLRTAQFVALVDSGRENVQPLHATKNVRISLEQALAQQLKTQGYRLEKNSDNTLRLDVLQAIVNVKHSVISHEMNSKIQLQIVVESPKGKFVKRYSGKSMVNGAGSASAGEIEVAMTKLMNAVLTDIHADQDLNNYLQEKL